MNRVLLLLLAVTMLASCKDNFMYHPNEVRPEYKNLNPEQISRIQNLPPKDTFSFILTGDTQLSNNELSDFINLVNSRNDVEFVLINGDLTEFGLNYEYNMFGRELSKLKMPFISVIGNHDMLGNGRLMYNKMFGAENFSFHYGNNLFVILNTNYREGRAADELPDLNWLQQELDNSHGYTNTFVASHIAPFSADFNPNKAQDYHDIISNHPGTRLSLHGHEHHYTVSHPYGDLPYLVTGSVGHRSYALVTVKGTTIKLQEVEF